MGAEVKPVFAAYQGRAGLDAIAGEWEAMTRACEWRVRFFHQPYWYRAFFDARSGDDQSVWFVTARRGNALFAVFPLQYQDYRLGALRPRLLGTIEDDQLQLSDFVFEQVPGNENLLTQLVRWLRSGDCKLHWHALRLRKVPDDGSLAYAARAHRPFETLALAHDGSCWIDVANGYEAATDPISDTFKRDFRRLTRRAEQTRPLRTQTCTLPQELDEAFRHFLDIEASGWKGDAGISGAILCQPQLLSFYQSVVREFGQRGECVINLLWYGDQPVAGQLCVREKRVLNILKIGFREEHANFAPGILLLDRIIRQSCEAPELDLLHFVNEPRWAKKFRPRRMDVWSYVIANTNPIGWLVLGGVWFKRFAARMTRNDERNYMASRPQKKEQAEASSAD